MRGTWLLFVVAALGCGDDAHAPDALYYTWDERRVLCSQPIDDYLRPLDLDAVRERIRAAADNGWVFIAHAHAPTITLDMRTLARVLELADDAGLAYYTFRELTPDGPGGAGLALAFDDDSTAQWMLVRDVLAQHGARVTFFVSNEPAMPSLGREQLAVLATDGHDLEPHTVTHAHGPAYVRAHSLADYLQREVLPSFTVLTDAGFLPPTAFAYPYGDHTPEIDEAVLQYVGIVRTTPGQCPY